MLRIIKSLLGILILSLLLGMPRASAMPSDARGQTVEEMGPFATHRYLVQLSSPSLAVYSSETAGLAPHQSQCRSSRSCFEHPCSITGS